MTTTPQSSGPSPSRRRARRLAVLAVAAAAAAASTGLADTAFSLAGVSTSPGRAVYAAGCTKGGHVPEVTVTG